ncbi:MAG TPA: Pvc16 family protein [Thermomicrobiales bacterium]|nr:Pvc16 family protein [Thermomicrobiales bacterium]
MLDALDETIKAVLREIGGMDPAEIDIAFEAPDREWASRVSKPTVNCYLYDIRENLELRGTDWIVERDPTNGNLVTKRQPPHRYDLSYVCTAWTADVEDEHRLLWRVLATFLQCPRLPLHLLRGELASVDGPIMTEVAQPDGLLRDPADVWSALDNRIRPSVNFVATLPLEDRVVLEAPLVLTRRIRIRQFGYEPEELIQIAGTVREANGDPCPQVTMRIQDHAYATVTNKDGRFWFGGIPEGTYTLIAQLDGLTAQRAVTVPGDEYDVLLASPTKGAKARKGG